ncbi:MAG: tRNA lysidine(34) synthetase TilS [Candidatus Saccharimonadales bacterium]
MVVNLEPGNYVVAVSGGVDSMVLLHILHSQYGGEQDMYQFVVAHYDHGIRPDSMVDASLVENTARSLGLAYEGGQGYLGENASEALAREKRYDFLRGVQQRVHANAIITAHQQDDVLETAIMNLLRGTGRKGLTSLASTGMLVRPLLDITKQDILVYAKSHNVAWREDNTNQDTAYTRNRIRHTILAKFKEKDRRKLLEIIDKQRSINQQIDDAVTRVIPLDAVELSRAVIVQVPYAVSCELLASWLRAHGLEFDQKTIHRLAVGVKVLQAGRGIEASGGRVVLVNKQTIALDQTQRSGKTPYKAV